MDQPTPDVTEADVQRVLRRDFEPADAVQVESLLRAADPGLSPRVALAVLKLSAGSVDAVRVHLEAARRDWRDVVAQAEYPTYMRTVPGDGSLGSTRRDEIIQADWEQYNGWLNR